MKKATVILLIIAVIYFFPLDINLFVNKVLGWGYHILLWVGLVIFVIYQMKGKTLKEKWHNFIKNIKINSH